MENSKWPRIKWNQANADLANAPFRDLFQADSNRCEVSHYVKYQDEGQQVTDYDYYWCNTHACICDPDGCRRGKTVSEDAPDDYELGNIGYPSVAYIINKMGQRSQED